MKEIYEQYGAVMIAILVGAILFGLLGVTASGMLMNGVHSMYLRGGAREVLRAENTMEASENLLYQYEKRAGITVRQIPGATFTAGENRTISSVIEVKNKDGDFIPFDIIRISNVNGDTVFPRESLNGLTVCFEQEGVYEVMLSAIDLNGCEQYAILKLPVQVKALPRKDIS